jgi:thiamine-phosphate pyrophosphorylase
MKPPSNDVLRIIDASLNRIGEGLRVLEEYARFSLDDVNLTQQLKNLRHKLVRVDPHLQSQLMRGRDSLSDVGSDMEVPGESKQRDVTGIISANARRVQEALRVMEETARDPDLGLETNSYKQARFELYTVEKELLSRILRKDKTGRLTGLYVIIDVAFLNGRILVHTAIETIRGGAKIIQLRDKQHSVKDFLAFSIELRDICGQHGVLYIVNDSLEVALASDADGLHIGQDDLPVAVARRLLPIDKILGCSASSLEEAKRATAEGADYLGVGAIYPTTSKDVSQAIGLDALKEIRRAVDIPLIAIGGINKSNVKAVLKTGADSAAVISAVMSADDVEKSTRELVEIIGGEHVK